MFIIVWPSEDFINSEMALDMKTVPHPSCGPNLLSTKPKGEELHMRARRVLSFMSCKTVHARVLPSQAHHSEYTWLFLTRQASSQGIWSAGSISCLSPEVCTFKYLLSPFISYTESYLLFFHVCLQLIVTIVTSLLITDYEHWFCWYV